MPPGRVIANFVTGTSGTRVEGRADAALVAVDPADQVDVHLAFEVGDQVRQRVVRGAQVDRAFERFAEQRREGAGRSRRPISSGRRLAANLTLVQIAPRLAWSRKSACGSADRGAGDVGVALAGSQHGPQFRVLGALGLPVEAQVEPRPEVQRRRSRWPGTGRDRRREKAAGLVGSAPPPRTAPAVAFLRQLVAVEREFLAVEVEEDRADVELGAAEDVGDLRRPRGPAPFPGGGRAAPGRRRCRGRRDRPAPG